MLYRAGRGYPIGVDLHLIIDALDRAMLGQGIAYYVVGSHADGTACAGSDLDLTVVAPVPGPVEYYKKRAFHDFPLDIDLEIMGERNLRKNGVPPDLKLGARLLRGR